jgi:hypothetical protein
MGPIPGLELLEGPIVVRERLPCSFIGRPRKRRPGRSRQARDRGGFLEQGGQGRGKRLLHHHAVAVGRDNAIPAVISRLVNMDCVSLS